MNEPEINNCILVLNHNAVIAGMRNKKLQLNAKDLKFTIFDRRIFHEENGAFVNDWFITPEVNLFGIPDFDSVQDTGEAYRHKKYREFKALLDQKLK